ncbi:MAG: hypothetical protein GQ565_11745 [Candidatus Aegiribacteria sp.]|nr:hypothetical protein [Candidatus Aegiribacteria sp.]
MSGNKWIDKLAESIQKVADEKIEELVMQDIRDIEPQDIHETVSLINEILDRMNQHLSPDQIADVLYGCSCRYPYEKLLRVREAYALNQSIDDSITVLQEQSENSLREGMLFPSEIVDRILQMNWGVAGRREGNRIFVTKIPRSGNLRKYMTEQDPVKKRELYCHCSILDKAVEENLSIPVSYCLCGAGFYRYIWETILEKTVQVEVLETVCSGGNKCSFSIILPDSVV